jgi:kynureninase
VRLNSPRDHRQRGSHVSIGHAEALRIDRALIEDLKVVPDFRYSDNIRLGIAPIYTSFADIHAGVLRMRRAIVDRLYAKYPSERPEIT